jgi:hypothetical protein
MPGDVCGAAHHGSWSCNGGNIFPVQGFPNYYHQGSTRICRSGPSLCHIECIQGFWQMSQ